MQTTKYTIVFFYEWIHADKLKKIVLHFHHRPLKNNQLHKRYHLVTTKVTF